MRAFDPKRSSLRLLIALQQKPGCLLDDIIGEREQRVRNGNADSPGGREVDDQLELYWRVTGLYQLPVRLLVVRRIVS